MAYKQRWLEYFEVLDVNGDGFIDRSDVDGVVNLAAKNVTNPAALAEIRAVATEFNANLIREFDANRDGKVSKEEWLQGVEKVFVGKTVETAPQWWQDLATRTFVAADINKNGEIAEEEYVKNVGNLSPSTNVEDVKKAYRHFKGEGKFDVASFKRVLFTWASSPNAEPEATTLTPYFRKH